MKQNGALTLREMRLQWDSFAAVGETLPQILATLDEVFAQ